MENQLELYDEIMRCRDKFQEELPDVLAAHTAFRDEVYEDGDLAIRSNG